MSQMGLEAGTANDWNGGPQKGAGNWRAFGGRTGVHRQWVDTRSASNLKPKNGTQNGPAFQA